jgi:hypothetical protein
MAMVIGDVFEPDDIQAWQLAEMCFECKLPQRQAARMLDSLCNNMLRSLTKIALPEHLTPAEEEFARNLIQVITGKVHRYQGYAKQLPGLKL